MAHLLGPGEGCIVCERVLEGAPVLYALHDEPLDEQDSGWQFLCGSEDHGEDGGETGSVVAVSHIVEREPQLGGFLAEPVGAELERDTDVHVFERLDLPEPSDGSYVCGHCSETHSGLPMDWSIDAPSYFDPDCEDEWSFDGSTAVWQRDDGEKHFFYEATLQLPVVDGHCSFQFSVWLTVSPENFAVVQHLLAEGAGKEITAPFFGWLSNELPGYPDTMQLKANSRFVPDAELPLVELEPTDHPLAVDQRSGISMRRVHELVDAYQ